MKNYQDVHDGYPFGFAWRDDELDLLWIGSINGDTSYVVHTPQDGSKFLQA